MADLTLADIQALRAQIDTLAGAVATLTLELTRHGEPSARLLRPDEVGR